MDNQAQQKQEITPQQYKEHVMKQNFMESQAALHDRLASVQTELAMAKQQVAQLQEQLEQVVPKDVEVDTDPDPELTADLEGYDTP